MVTAGSGGEALAVLSENRQIDILVTDLNMPGMDGYELADQAARLRPDLRILLVSDREGDGHGLPILRKPFLGSRADHEPDDRADASLAFDLSPGSCPFVCGELDNMGNAARFKGRLNAAGQALQVLRDKLRSKSHFHGLAGTGIVSPRVV